MMALGEAMAQLTWKGEQRQAQTKQALTFSAAVASHVPSSSLLAIPSIHRSQPVLCSSAPRALSASGLCTHVL